MTLIVGSAATTYDLDLRPFRQSVQTARRELAQFQRDMAALGARAAALPAPGLGARGAAVGAGPSSAAARQAAEVARAESLAAQAVARRQREEVQLAEALAKAAVADQRRATEVARTEAAQERAAAAAARRRQVEARGLGTNNGLPVLPRTIAGLSGAAAGAAGALGLTVGAAELVRYGVEAGKASIALDRTLSLTRELAGDQAVYNQVLAAAREQQRLYGGTLQENVEGLSGLVITARSSGAELEQLINLSQRLSLLDPSQGTTGARIALSEALSGDPRSLALRYEIPRSALEKLKDESLGASERLAVLDQYLNKIGITSQVVGSTISDQALAYNELGIVLDRLRTGVGGGLAEAFSYAARGAARLGGEAGGLQAVATYYQQLFDRLTPVPPVQQAVADGFGQMNGGGGDWSVAATGAQAATGGLTAAVSTLTEEQRKQILAQAEAEAGARQLAVAQSAIDLIGQQVAQGLLTQAQGAQILGRDFGYAADEANRLAGEAARAAQATRGPASATEDRATRQTAQDSAEAAAAGAAAARERQAAIEAARREQLLATGTAAQVVAVRQQELNEAIAQYGKGSADAIRAETALIEARQRQQQEQERAAAAQERATTRTARTGARAITQTATTLGRIEDRTEDHYRKLQQLQEDYQQRARRSEEDFQLRRSRGEEDFQRQKQRLLAEGKIAEARLLEEEFRREQARDAQDQARTRQRGAEDLAEQQRRQAADLGLDTGRIVDRAALRGVNVPGGAQAAAGAITPTGAAQASGAITPLPTAGGGGVAIIPPPRGIVPIELRVQIQPTPVMVGDGRLIDIIYPPIAERFDADLEAGIISIGLTAPPAAGQSAGVGGPRP